jgi:hypothetical protein
MRRLDSIRSQESMGVLRTYKSISANNEYFAQCSVHAVCCSYAVVREDEAMTKSVEALIPLRAYRVTLFVIQHTRSRLSPFYTSYNLDLAEYLFF